MATSGPGRQATTDSWQASVLELLRAHGIDALLAQRSAVVVERIARGGGSTAWYRLNAPGDLARLIAELRPGSEVRFAFDDAFVEGPFDDEMAQGVEAIAGRDGDAVILALGEAFELEHDFPASADEAREFTAGLRNGSTVLVGGFPGDIKVVLPDADGIVRPHPH